MSNIVVISETEIEVVEVTPTAVPTIDITSPGPQGPPGPSIGITGGLETPTHVLFDTTTTETAGVAKMMWDDAEGTLSFGLKGGNVDLHIGQKEIHQAVNKSGVNLTKGKVVAVLGAQGNRISITRAQANAEATSIHTFGFTAEAINNNNTGFVTSSGILDGLNTLTDSEGNAMVEGDTLYLSTSVLGGYTKVKPTAPNHLVILGFVVRVNANVGQIFVKVDNGYEINELHNVRAYNPQNKSVLAWDSALQVWDDVSAAKLVRVGTNGAQLSGTFSIDSDLWDQFNFTGLTGAITINHPAGTPVDGQKLMIRIKDNGTTRYVTWDTAAAGFRTVGTTLPTATVAGKTIYIGSIYNAADGYWDVVAVVQEA